MISSIIHHLQGKGSRDLQVVNVNRGFRVTPVGFLDKLANRPGDFLPVFSASIEDAQIILGRFNQIHAELGLNYHSEALPAADAHAALSLITEELLSVPLPATRFAFELGMGNSSNAIVVEALKKRETTHTDEVRYTPSEIRGMKVRDCNYLHVYFLAYPLHEPDTGIALHPMKISIPMAEASKAGKLMFEEVGLSGHDFEIASGPPGMIRGTPIAPSAIFKKMTSDDKQTTANTVNFFVEVALDLLWVLERDPKLLQKNTEAFSKENASRRALRRPAFSPVHTVSIDQTELRRAEFEQATIITNLLAEKGSYSIPGLVLVSPSNPRSTRQVKAYARCAEPEVRSEATLLLQKWYETGNQAVAKELAEYVRAFGARHTQARFGSSQLNKITLV